VYYIYKKKVTKTLTDNDDDNTRTVLSKQIKIKIGAKVMIRHNIDANLSLVNGTIAQLCKIQILII